MSSRTQRGEAVHGPSWRHHGDRRRHAVRIAWKLRPVTHVLGGLVSTELSVRYRDRWYRPDVGVLLGGAIPETGTMARAPMLVVCLGGPLSGADWLAAGAGAVWVCDDGAVVRELSRRGPRVVAGDGWLTHPDEAALLLSATHLRTEAATPPAGPAARHTDGRLTV
ncbi:hypothetical protein BH23ACT10_BH23ACT10_28970 [soil metagenome]